MAGHEVDAMLAAYEALKGLDRPAWERALVWIKGRLVSDARTANATQAIGVQPETWAVSGTSENEESPTDVASEWCEFGEVLEIDGTAVVQRRFAVRYAIDEDGCNDVMLFETREEAEAFLTALQHPA